MSHNPQTMTPGLLNDILIRGAAPWHLCGLCIGFVCLEVFPQNYNKNSIWLLATTVELIFSVQINWLSEKDLGSIHQPVSTAVA